MLGRAGVHAAFTRVWGQDSRVDRPSEAVFEQNFTCRCRYCCIKHWSWSCVNRGTVVIGHEGIFGDSHGTLVCFSKA